MCKTFDALQVLNEEVAKLRERLATLEAKLEYQVHVAPYPELVRFQQPAKLPTVGDPIPPFVVTCNANNVGQGGTDQRSTPGNGDIGPKGPIGKPLV